MAHDFSRAARVVAIGALVSGCGAPAPEPAAPAPPPAEPPMTLPPLQVTAAPGPTQTPSSYAGHGVESLPPEVLQKYRPQPLAADVSRRIQAYMDISGPGMGAITPDGKRLFFGWSVTGVAQLFRLDGAMRFPVQLTGGEDPTTLVGVTPTERS
jgi:hypothetical protein